MRFLLAALVRADYSSWVFPVTLLKLSCDIMALGYLYICCLFINISVFPPPPWLFSVAKLRGRLTRSVLKFGRERIRGKSETSLNCFKSLRTPQDNSVGQKTASVV